MRNIGKEKRLNAKVAKAAKCLKGRIATGRERVACLFAAQA